MKSKPLIQKMTERWTSVVVKHHGEAFEKDVYDKYEVSCRCRIRNKTTGKILSGKSEQVGLLGGGVRKMLKRHRICLASFYPDKIPKKIHEYDCDHIDGNHNNNRLDNLQWLHKSEHAKKTMEQTKRTRKSRVEKAGKMVVVVAAKNDTVIGPSMVGRTFGSTTCAGRALGVLQSNVSQSVKKGYWVKNMYRFALIEQPLLRGEIFKEWNGYWVSNKGRYKHKNGKISTGTRHNGGRYHVVVVNLNGKRQRYYVHILVWEAFNGPIPPGKVVMHNDTYDTLDDEGYERNYLEDLSLGTQQENTQSYQDNRKDLKRVRCIDDGNEFRCAAEAGRYFGLRCDQVSEVCRKKRKTAGGKKFEYVN